MNSPASESQRESLWDQPLTETAINQRTLFPSRRRGALAPSTGWRWIWNKLPASRSQALPCPGETEKRPSLAMARPRRMKQTARALLLWIPFWYVIAQAALFVWMNERWHPIQNRVEHRKWKQLHRRLAEAPDRPLVLMLGSSRTDWSFQAGKLTGMPGPDGKPLLAYNFGVPATGALHEALYVNDLLDEGIRPRLLLVEFPTTHLNRPRRGLISEEYYTLGAWLSAHQVRFYSPYFANPRRARGAWLEAWLSPWYAYRWTVHDHLLGVHSMIEPFNQAKQPMDSWGSRILIEDPGTPEYRAYRKNWARALYLESLQRFQLGQGPIHALRDLLERCRRERVAVALVVMPETAEFRSLYTPQALADIQQVLSDLRRDFGVEVIDTSNWPDAEDFDDGHHLLKAGATKFTTRLVQEVQMLLARTSSAAKGE